MKVSTQRYHFIDDFHIDICYVNICLFLFHYLLLLTGSPIVAPGAGQGHMKDRGVHHKRGDL